MAVVEQSATARQRFLVAGLGGVTPVLLSLIVVDLETLLLRVTALALASYLIRVVALFAVGGLVGWLHKNEVEPLKLFQLGIAAPALITAAINGGRITLPQSPAERAPVSWSLVSPAHAQEAPTADPKQFSLPEESRSQQIYRGLFGAVPKNVWFVIAGSHPSREAAENHAAAVRTRGFPAEVYAPYGENPYYAVVLGAQITLPEARELQQRAIASGLPRDTYLWTFPQK